LVGDEILYTTFPKRRPSFLQQLLCFFAGVWQGMQIETLYINLILVFGNFEVNGLQLFPFLK